MMDTTQYAVAVYIHTSIEYGYKKENVPGVTLRSCTYKMLIPNVKNGTEKSTTFFLSSVIVRSQTAKSAF